MGSLPSSEFFFIDRRAIPDAMVWRHLNTAIDDPRPAASSFNMAGVQRLSAQVIKLRDMLEDMGIHDFLCLLEWTGAEVQEEPHLDVRPTLQRLPFYRTPPAAAEAVIPDPTLEDLAIGTPSFKIVAKAEASQKERPLLLVPLRAIDNDDDACVEIPLVTPLRSADVIPSSGNQGGSSVTPTAEGSNTRGKGIMVDNVAAPFAGEVFKDPTVCKTIVDQFPTPREMVRVKSLSNDQLTAKMSVLHCMMMSHGGELLARYRRLNQSHHEYVLSTDSRLKGYEEKVANMTGLELQVSALKKQVSGLNDKLSSFDASFAKSKAKGNERKKKIKSLTKSLDNLHTKVARLSVALNQGLVWKFLASDEFSRVQGELLSLSASAGFERSWSMHRTKDEFATMLKKMINFMSGMQDRLAEASPLIVTPASKSLELSTHVDLTAFVVASKHNKDMVTAEVDGSDPNMTDDTITAKSGHAFMQGMSVVLDYVVELVGVGSRHVSSSPNDVVVALSAGEKGDGLTPSFVSSEEADVNPSWV
ncbi:hypothetical protein Tco_0010851 [Tanacetum coccineum]